jgi:heme exporter protein D
MLDLGKHAVFIWSSYGVVVFVLAALVAWLISDGGRLKRRLDDLETRGVRRRSAAADGGHGA